MNTSKNNIEYQIKKQISEREITPSRDLWSEIKSQSVDKAPKSNMNWLLAAACLVLTFSLGAVLFMDKNEIEKPKVISGIKKSTLQEKTEDPAVNSLEVAEQKQQESVAVEKISTGKKKKTVESQTVIEQEQLPLIKENTPEIRASIYRIKPENIIAKSDSAKIQVKKKRYVDPSTLLFSVEHKDVIEKTKEGSNVATIDVNLR
ncbi:hypothetical protein [Chryseobacterium salviniae]|uniref:Uncharacterized protein n=1 Tax=Chryseobacterium salviniae TaxID=3101750 RepID=A0ABU6HV95_9FLAO|nr:hypothetical protein [Chryseobacterium sp. T9W2-O]MEC3876611.1 hypothetical protein [Chryseobacterium sp. T9W2-O]